MQVQKSGTAAFLYTRGIKRNTTIMEYSVGYIRSFGVVYGYIPFACLPCSFKKGTFKVVLSKIPNQDHYLALPSLLQRFATFQTIKFLSQLSTQVLQTLMHKAK